MLPKYYIEGEISIPKDKLNEMNDIVLKILDRGGMRNSRKISIANTEITVADRVSPDDDGKVYFDYNIFENYQRSEKSYYDTNTGLLHVDCFGYREHRMVIILVMAVQEAYSEAPCFLMRNGKFARLFSIAMLVLLFTGTPLFFKYRGRVWDMALTLHANEDYEDFSFMDYIQDMPPYFSELDTQNLYMALSASEELYEESDFTSDFRVKYLKYSEMQTYALQLIKAEIIKNGTDEVQKAINELIKCNYEKREEYSKTDTKFISKLAELSLYLPSTAFICAYAIATDDEFWNVWESFDSNIYSDEICPNTKTEIRRELNLDSVPPLYKYLEYEDEDEFIDTWESGDLNFSPELRESIKTWQESYSGINEIADDFSVEEILGKLILLANNEWQCRIVESSMIEDFLENKDVYEYKKAVKVLDMIIKQDYAYFPELTEEQINEYIMYKLRTVKDSVILGAYLSLLANKKQRRKVFGF